MSILIKNDPKRRFRSSKNDKKTCRILRIMLFGDSDFYDRLWQNNRFDCMICTTFWKKKSFKRDQRRAAAMQNVYSYLREEQNYQRWSGKRWASKRSKLLGKPHPPSIFCVFTWEPDFPRVYVLKHLVKNMKINARSHKNSARHLSETHNNNWHSFSAMVKPM